MSRPAARALAPALALVLALAMAGCSLPSEGEPLQWSSLDGAPVHFAAGSDAGPYHLSPRVPAFVLAPDGSLAVEIVGSPEARLEIGSLFRVVNDGDAPAEVALSTPRLAFDGVAVFRVALGDDPAATLDLLAPQPSAHFTLAPGESRDARVVLEVTSGTRDRALSVAALTVSVMSP